MTHPQLIQLGKQGAPPAQPAQPPQARIPLFAQDQALCSDLIKVGLPQELVLDIATALSEKLTYADETERVKAQNAQLLTANQNLLQQRETLEAEVRKYKKAAGELRVAGDQG